MKFLKKNWIALTIFVVLLAASVFVGSRFSGISIPTAAPKEQQSSAEWIWISDSAGLLTEESEEKLAEYNAVLDSDYNSIVAVVTVQSTNGKTTEDYAFEQGDALGLGRNDMLLLLTVQEKDWYCAVSAAGTLASAVESDDTLRQIFKTALQGDSLYQSADDAVLSVFSQLEPWYRQHITRKLPEPTDRVQEQSPIFGILFLIVFALFFILPIIRFLIYPICVFPIYHTWHPLWGWGIFGPHFHHYHHGPPPPHFGGHGPHFDGGFGGGGHGGFGGGSFGGGGHGGFGR